MHDNPRPLPVVVRSDDFHLAYRPEETVTIEFAHGNTTHIERLTRQQAAALQSALSDHLIRSAEKLGLTGDGL